MKPSCLIGLVLAACSGASHPAGQVTVAPAPVKAGPAAVGDPGFPLAAGLTWIYRAEVTWTDGQRDFSKQLTWIMKIAEVTAHGALTVAHVTGHPFDLAWYDPDQTKPGDWLIIAAPAGPGTHYYMARADARLVARARDAGDPLTDVTTGDNLELALPLAMGQSFCPPGQPKRDDTWYCRTVEDIAPAQLEVKGASAPAGARAYTLALRTNSDQSVQTWVPGVGITRWTWNHHGTLSDADLTLVEVRR